MAQGGDNVGDASGSDDGEMDGDRPGNGRLVDLGDRGVEIGNDLNAVARCLRLGCKGFPGTRQQLDVCGSRMICHGRISYRVAGRQSPRSLGRAATEGTRSEEHTSELPSLMRISYAV